MGDQGAGLKARFDCVAKNRWSVSFDRAEFAACRGFDRAAGAGYTLAIAGLRQLHRRLLLCAEAKLLWRAACGFPIFAN